MNHLRNALSLFFNFCLIILILFIYPNSSFSANTANWKEIARSSNGIQFIDTDNLKYRKGILTTHVKYTEINPDSLEILDTSIFRLDINCENRLLKKDSDKKWQEPKSKLNKQTIMKSCSF